MERLEKDQIQLMGIISSLKAQRDFECLKGEPEYFVGLSEASDELKAVNSQKNELEEIIRTMENGQYKELKEKKRLLEKNIDALKSAFSLNQQQINEKISQHEKIIGANEQRRAQLEDMLQAMLPERSLRSRCRICCSIAQEHRSRANSVRNLLSCKAQTEMVAGSSRVWRRCRLPATGI